VRGVNPRPGRFVALLATLLLLSAGAGAHITITGLARITLEEARVTYSLDVVLSQIPAPSAAAIRAATTTQGAAEELAERLRKALVVQADGTDCRSGRIRVQGSRSDQERATLQVEFSCANPPRHLLLRERWDSFLGEHYGTIASLRTGSSSREVMLNEEVSEATFDLAGEAPSSWGDFIRLGTEHILGGLDHLLFLLALLAPARRLLSVIKIATGFTIAHSITLSLAVLHLIPVPSSVVEPLIAASIIAVAAENLWLGREPRWRWAIAFGFGLVHGMGFAGGLLELELPSASLIPALVGFNIGVEIGQLAVVILVYPLVHWVTRPQRWPGLVKVLSCIVAIAGTWWLLERLFLA